MEVEYNCWEVTYLNVRHGNAMLYNFVHYLRIQSKQLRDIKGYTTAIDLHHYKTDLCKIGNLWENYKTKTKKLN